MSNPKVTVLILCTNEKKFLKELLVSVFRQTYQNIEIYVLDNNSTDGSKELISKFKHQIVNLEYFKFEKNLGYAKGNNYGLRKAFKASADFCLILNCDTILKKDTIEQLVISYQENSKENRVGLIQPVILLAYDKKRVNGIGNAIHYLGFGYCQDYLKIYQPLKKDKEIISVSGAALFIAKDYYQNVGDFDETFFMTSEDQDLSWRGLLAGYSHFLSARSAIFHHYQFGRHKLNKYREEKNRLMILLKNYSLKSLILLAPILIINELAILIYSLFEGWFLLKLKTYWILLLNTKTIFRHRKKIQKTRIVDEKTLFRKFQATINFKPLNNFAICRLANPVYWFYYQLIKIFI